MTVLGSSLTCLEMTWDLLLSHLEQRHKYNQYHISVNEKKLDLFLSLERNKAIQNNCLSWGLK
jgi:hypothetical protein